MIGSVGESLVRTKKGKKFKRTRSIFIEAPIFFLLGYQQYSFNSRSKLIQNHPYFFFRGYRSRNQICVFSIINRILKLIKLTDTGNLVNDKPEWAVIIKNRYLCVQSQVKLYYNGFQITEAVTHQF